MKTISKIFILAAVAGLFAACQQDDIVPDTPVGEYVKVRFTTADGTAGKASTRAAWHDPKGSGNLYFDWEKYPTDGPGLLIAMQDKEEFLYSYKSDTPAEGEEPIGSSFLTVEPVEEYDETDGADKYSNWANFETVRYYDAEDIKYATRVLAVAPVQHDDENPVVWTPTDFYAEASMPTSFTQTASGDPSFLRDYMIMCGSAEMNNGTASIEFEHIPATFRFIITNKRPSAATIKSVKISRDDEGNIGSTLVRFGARTDTDFFRQLENPCTGITTVISGDDAVLDTGGKYTAYAMALPIGEYNEQNALKNKKIQFTIGAGNPDNEYLSFVLDGSQIAAVNPKEEYDWVGGKSYTIRMSLSDVLTFEGITVADWNEKESINAGEAEDMTWKNGFNRITGDYEPAQLNADGYYEIKNGGNLFWFANHVNTADRTANAVLTANIDLEGRPWTPIGSTGEDSHNFRGIFDGQNYTIRGLNVEGGRAGLGFFGEVRTGTVKNFTIYGEVVVNTEVDYVGGVIGSICGLNGENDLERNGAIIQNITSYVNLTAKVHGTGMIGGFVGYANHQSLIEKCSWYGTFDAGIYRVDNGAGGFIGRIRESSSEVTIRNCAAYGTIKTNYEKNSYNNTATIYMGGFLSYSNTGAKTTLENCLFAGKFERGANLTDEAELAAFGTLTSVNSIKNCYYLADEGLTAVHSGSSLTPGENIEITPVTKEELRGGTIATQLGGSWTQGENYPVIKK